MLAYWDLSDKERASLSEKDVEGYLLFVYAERGLPINVKEPIEPEVPSLPTPEEEVYEVSGLGYYKFYVKTYAEAERFLETTAYDTHSFYLGNRYVEYLGERAQRMEVKKIKVYSYAQYKEHQSEIAKHQELRRIYSKEKEQYDKLQAELTKAAESLWEDWSNLQYRKRICQQVVDSWNQYMEMTEGDKKIAARFLKKRFSDPRDIDIAVEWGYLDEIKELKNEDDTVSEE